MLALVTRMQTWSWSVRDRLRTAVRDSRGLSTVEYVLIAALAVAIVVAVGALLVSAFKGAFSAAQQKVQQGVNTAGQ